MKVFLLVAICMVTKSTDGYLINVSEGDNVTITCGVKTIGLNKGENIIWKYGATYKDSLTVAYDVDGHRQCIQDLKRSCSLLSDGSLVLLDVVQNDTAMYYCAKGSQGTYKYFSEHELVVKPKDAVRTHTGIMWLVISLGAILVIILMTIVAVIIYLIYGKHRIKLVKTTKKTRYEALPIRPDRNQPPLHFIQYEDISPAALSSSQTDEDDSEIPINQDTDVTPSSLDIGNTLVKDGPYPRLQPDKIEGQNEVDGLHHLHNLAERSNRTNNTKYDVTPSGLGKIFNSYTPARDGSYFRPQPDDLRKEESFSSPLLTEDAERDPDESDSSSESSCHSFNELNME